MAGQGVILVSELHDETIVGSRILTASTQLQALFVADRDMFLNQAWFKSATTETDGETYQLWKVPDGTPPGSGTPVALTDAIEVHTSGAWVASTKQDFVPSTTNFIAEGDTVYIKAGTAFQTSTEIMVGWRTVTRRQ